MWRGNDRGGRCLYTFTVPSPVEASCPQTAGPEVEGLKARLGVLEAMVAQLVGGGERNPQRAGATSQPELQEALKRAVGERNLLQGEKRRLEQEVERVQRLMEEMRRETERLKDRQCPPQTPPAPPAPSLQGSGLLRPAGGKDQHPRQTRIFECQILKVKNQTCTLDEMMVFTNHLSQNILHFLQFTYMWLKGGGVCIVLQRTLVHVGAFCGVDVWGPQGRSSQVSVFDGGLPGRVHSVFMSRSCSLFMAGVSLCMSERVRIARLGVGVGGGCDGMYSVEVVGQDWWGRLRGRQGSRGQEHYTSRLRLKPERYVGATEVKLWYFAFAVPKHWTN